MSDRNRDRSGGDVNSRVTLYKDVYRNFSKINYE